MGKSSKDKFHFFMIAGNVVVAVGDDNVQAIPTNAMMHGESRNLGLHQIRKAQQALQISLHHKMGEIANVVDVIIISVTHLGYMTEAEFQAVPEGLAAVEQSAPSAEIVNLSDVIKG